MRRVGLYSFIALAFVAVVGVLAVSFGVLDRGGGPEAEQANGPAVSESTEQKAPETKQEKTEEEQEEENEEEQPEPSEQADQESDQEAEQRSAEEKAAAEVAEEQQWRELAERQEAEDRAAEERRAAEQRASEQAQQEVQPAPPANGALSLTVPSAGIQNDPVTDSIAEGVLANGAGKVPQTGFPWQEGSNTYIAAHVYGYPGTGSWQQFARVPNMTMGDQIFLTDSNGTTYEYRVNEILTVSPTDVWVAEPTGQTVVSLQTCVGPNWSERLVVRGTLTGTSQA